MEVIVTDQLRRSKAGQIVDYEYAEWGFGADGERIVVESGKVIVYYRLDRSAYADYIKNGFPGKQADMQQYGITVGVDQSDGVTATTYTWNEE
jgi:hypothetical protein